MAKYLILIYGDEQRWGAMSPDEIRALDQAHRDFNKAAGAVAGTGGCPHRADPRRGRATVAHHTPGSAPTLSKGGRPQTARPRPSRAGSGAGLNGAPALSGSAPGNSTAVPSQVSPSSDS